MKRSSLRWMLPIAALAFLIAGCGVRPPELYETRYENPQSATNDPHFAAAAQARAELGTSLKLDGVMTLAALNNPMTTAAWYRLQAAQELRPQAVSLPDPKLEGRYFFHRGDSNYMLMLSQELPFPTKLLVAGDQADRQTAAAAVRYNLAVRNAIAESKIAFYELYYIDRAQTVTRALAELYARYAALAAGNPAESPAPAPMPAQPADGPAPGMAPAGGAPSGGGMAPASGMAPGGGGMAPGAGQAPARAKIPAGGALPAPVAGQGDAPMGGASPSQGPALPELFRAQSQLAQARYDLALLTEMRAAQSQMLLAALGLDPDTAVGATEELPPPPPLGLTLAELRSRAARTNQELAVLRLDRERADLAVSAANQAPLPDFMVGVSYEDMKAMPTDKDPIGLSVGLTLPLWWGKYSAMQREAAGMAHAMAAEQKGAELKLNADLAAAWFSLQNKSRLVRLYGETLLPQARQALRSAEERYRQNNTTLLAVLEATATVHNFELAHLRATADFYQQVARLEQLVGAPLVLAPAPPAPAPAAPPAPAAEPQPTTVPEAHP